MENKILYSEQAYNDGYDFSSLTESEQKLTREYYYDKEEIGKVARLVEVARYYIRHSDFDCSVKPLIDYDWRFLESGTYEGVIVRCSKSLKKDSEDYIIELMLDEDTIKYIKFNPYSNGTVISAILDELEYQGSFSKIIGRYVILDVDNNIYSGNKIFSNVTSFEFVDEDIINLHLKMWEIMKETDLKNMIRAKNSKSL